MGASGGWVLLRRACLALLAALLATALPEPGPGSSEVLAAQDEQEREATPEEALVAAKALIQAGRPAEALAVIEAVKSGDALPDGDLALEATFLEAQARAALGDDKTAIALYRAMLAQRPALVRVRLELARLLFQTGDDAAARYHFEQALAADPPPTVRSNIESFLAAIEARRGRVDVRLSFALAPDTNINAAPSRDQISLFGLPAQLSDEATQRSGIGLASRALVSSRFQPEPASRIELDGDIARSDYTGSDFDDMTVGLSMALARRLGPYEARVRGRATRRWFADVGYNRALGLELEGARTFAGHTTLRGAGGWRRAHYDVSTFLDGPTLWGEFGVIRTLGAGGQLGLNLGIQRERTRESAFANRAPRIGAFYQRELPWGAILGLRPVLAWRRYDSIFAAAGLTRRDQIFTAETSLSLTRLSVLGFAPVASYIYTRNRSNIDLFDYTRHQFQLGVTRVF